ncbi:PfkB family carbohydrate kinase [Gymnodinialimonas hymeniacidonis]|uniref:PfkB family carbohydrate kinase n=1 Tax=Gymnodinialimonas hymeniacidonis TaxID=3126508 RepID=UPI0034C63543
MTQRPDILCIGAVLWDIIGRTHLPMVQGNDKPGRITRIPGGVALNIAMALRKLDLRPALLSAIGEDAEGRDLLAACGTLGLDTSYIHIDPSLPTDRYMAIEAQGALVAAIADAQTLEKAGRAILKPLADGALGSAQSPWAGPVALDGNLSADLLEEVSRSPLFSQSDLRIAPASPGKAERLRPFLVHPQATLYVNREEAGLITGTNPANAAAAAEAMLRAGARRVLVTEGAQMAVDATPDSTLTQTPPPVEAIRITGAGDTFMAAHIAAEIAGATRHDALHSATTTAATYVAGDAL